LLVKELAAVSLAHAQQTTQPSHGSAAPAREASSAASPDGDGTTGQDGTAALLSALTARVAPLVGHAACPPPLRLAALEALQVAAAFAHALPAAVGPWAAEVLPPCAAAAARDLVNLPPTTAEATWPASGVPLERVAAPCLSLLRAALARSAVFACFQGARDLVRDLDRDLALDHARDLDVLPALVLSTDLDVLPALVLSTDLDVLPALVLSTDHDVRCAALKGVKKVLRHWPPAAWARTAAPLDALLFEALAREKYPPSQRRLLTCLAALRAASANANATQDGARDAARDGAWAAQWSLLARLHAGDGRGPDGEVSANSLALMGCLLGQATSDASSPHGVPSGVPAAWLVNLRSAAQPHLKPCMRLAAVESVLASGCLAVPLTSSARGSARLSSSVVLGVWFLCFALVLDDDEDVRDAAAHALTAGGEGTDLIRASELRPCNARALEIAMDKLTAKVLASHTVDGDLIGDYAGHLMGLWRSASTSLVQARASDEDDGAAPASEGVAGSGGEGDEGAGASRAIFEVEEDNLYSEPALVAQLAARQLALLFSAASAAASPGLAAAARALDASLLDALKLMLRDARANPKAAGSHASPLHGRVGAFQAAFVAAAALGCGRPLSAAARSLAVELQAAGGFGAAVHPVLGAAIEAACVPLAAQGGQAPSHYFFLAAPPTAQ
jgi:hypothetical protein